MVIGFFLVFQDLRVGLVGLEYDGGCGFSYFGMFLCFEGITVEFLDVKQDSIVLKVECGILFLFGQIWVSKSFSWKKVSVFCKCVSGQGLVGILVMVQKLLC